MPTSPRGSGESTDRGPGRPRSREADLAIEEAALDLLSERGSAGLTMEGIARRAGVGKATLYRRWKSPEAVLSAAVASFVSRITVPDTGSIEDDLRHLMRRAVRVYQGRPGRILPGLVSAMARSPELAHAVREGFLAGRRRALRQILERGIARGELRPDADLPLALDFLGGPLFYRLLVTGGAVDDDLADGVVEILLGGIAADAHLAPGAD